MFADRRSVLVIVAMCLACAAIVGWCTARRSVEQERCVAKAAPEFPCADHGCGCATSEQCRNACCCHGQHALDAPEPAPLEIATLIAREQAHPRVVASIGQAATAVLTARDCSCGRSPQTLVSAPAAATVAVVAPKLELDGEPRAFAEMSPASYRARRPSPAAPPPRESLQLVS